MMFGSENYMQAYHQKHAQKGGVPSLNGINNSKPLQSYGSKMPRVMMNNKPDSLENQIAQLWKGIGEPYASTDDIWKFCPNTASDYSSLSSASQSPEDHTETFFNVASQLQRQTSPEMHSQRQDLPDYTKLFDYTDNSKDFKGSPDSQVKNSLCCQYILNGSCERGQNCIFAHSIMQIGQPIL